MGGGGCTPGGCIHNCFWKGGRVLPEEEKDSHKEKGDFKDTATARGRVMFSLYMLCHRSGHFLNWEGRVSNTVLWVGYPLNMG